MNTPPRPGDRLPNGAVVLHATETTVEGTVLAYFGGAQPWVTWRYRAGDLGSTWAGHYTTDLADAVADYRRRGGDDRMVPTTMAWLAHTRELAATTE
jgi:hypothetical protein